MPKALDTAVLTAEDLWFRYPSSPNWVLRGVNIEIRPSEVVLILGASGSGKTTLLRALTSVGTSVYGGEARGSIVLGGRRFEELAPDEIRRIVQVVNQNAYTHFVEHSIGLDLYHSSIAIHGPSRGEKMFRKVVNIFKLNGLLKRRFFELSGGQLRRAAIAKAMLWDPLVVVLDEPLMWLDDEGLSEVREVVIAMKSLGKAIIIFEHRFLGLLDLASKIYILKNGTLTPVEHERLRYPRKVLTTTLSKPNSGEVVKSSGKDRVLLRVVDVWFKYEKREDWLLKEVYLDIASPGDTLVIYGRNGSGKSTLLKLLAGYLAPMLGRVEKSPKARTVYIPQNIYMFFTEESLSREFEVACYQHRGGKDCVERGIETLRSLGVDLEVDASPFNLSWGQAVRASISIAMSLGEDVVLLIDEPFTGLTYADRLSLARLLTEVEAPKVITLSNRETMSLVPATRAFELKDGYLKAIKPRVDPEVVEAAEKCRELGISGVL